MKFLLSRRMDKTNLKIFCFTLILFIPVLSLPVSILRNVFVFCMFHVLWTVLVTLRQICMLNLLIRTKTYWLLVFTLSIQDGAYLIAKPSVYYVFVPT